MIPWSDIACIVFVCVTANHLGLIEAIQLVLKWNTLPIVSCPKCLTFWMTLVYGCCNTATYGTMITVLAVSFLASYSAIWLEMLEGYVDTLYLKCYEKIYPPADNDADTSDSD